MVSPPRPFSRRSLAFRVSLIVVCVEVVIFFLVGLLYLQIHDRQMEKELGQRIRAVTRLVSSGALAYDALGDKDLVGRLVGKGFEEAMVVGFTGIIFNATDPSLVGRDIRSVPSLDPEWFTQARNGGFTHTIKHDGRHEIIAVFPVLNAADGAAFVYTFLRVDKSRVSQQSHEFFLVLLLGSALGGIVTSLALLVSFRRLVFSRLRQNMAVMERLTGGDLSARIPLLSPIRRDELGWMAHGFNEMAESMESNVTRLKQEVENRTQAEAALSRAKAELEERVERRTMDLDRSNRELKREIEERKAAEAAMRESHKRLQGILDHSPSAISLVNSDGRFIMANLHFMLLFAAGRTDIAGLSRAEVYGQENAQVLSVLEDQALAERKPMADEESFTVEGEVRTYMTTAFPLFNEYGAAFAACAIRTDVSDRKRLEAESLRAGQLASLGELAAGVAHEINNPLNGIVNYAEIIHDELADGPCHDLAAKIIHEGERVSRIVAKLLAFSRSRSEQFEPVQVREVVDDALQLLEGGVNRGRVAVDIQVDDTLPRIRARAHEIRQVLLNILNNALHAVTHGQTPRPDPLIRIEARTALHNSEAFVDISITDNGYGIPESAMNRILSPFFSLKPHNEGTGLGLSITHAIVKGHGGRLDIASKEHEYTRVTVSIPIYGDTSFS
ncbi:ATP-binding protein [Oceanidesulfovibrio marinus]|uniref:histidine kinase n=1 Tax=Oceanidesulfovibrio marinus TaxID=370038 RepID=A0ABX6NCF4_9BACT|nr:ATP-binding protein [Oceanidesulfovibrio marinus]QJT07482.1 HAMP domain-containing protein [Oceanidesulfovibrio marinus]